MTALLAGLALMTASAQETSIPFGCRPIPIPGTVQQGAVVQARRTNAQIYSAASFVERVVFPRVQQKVANDEQGLVWAFEVSALAGVAYVPSAEMDCTEELAYTNHRVDLFGSATGLAFSVGKTTFYYAGSLTGHLYAKRVTSGFVPFAYGLGTALAGPLATVPLTYIDVENEEGTSSVTGDYFLGVDTDLKYLHASAAFIGSTGLYANATGKLVRLFAATAVTESGVDYFRAGLDRQKTVDGAGFSSAFARNQNFVAPASPDEPEDEAERARTPFQTMHFGQSDIAGILDLHFAYALRPEPLVHDLRVGLHTPVYAMGKKILGEGEGFYDFEDLTSEGGLMSVPIGIQFGQVTLPPLPFYGTTGGNLIHVQAEAFYIFPSGNTGGALIMYTFKANDPETLAAFPYAEDALSHYFTIQIF